MKIWPQGDDAVCLWHSRGETISAVCSCSTFNLAWSQVFLYL
jgi:hypothetical protein